MATFLRSALLAFAALLSCARSQSQQFLAPNEDRLAEVLNSTLRALNGGSDDRKLMRQFENIERSIAMTYQAIPKAQSGRLMPPAVRHLVKDYFSHAHGMFIEGMSAWHGQASSAQKNILTKRAPALVQSLLEGFRNGRGLSFEDLVVMIATLERLIFSEVRERLISLYRLNDLHPDERLGRHAMEHLLTTYALFLRYGFHTENDRRTYLQFMDTVSTLETYDRFVFFQRDILNGFLFSKRNSVNPFKAVTFSFDDSVELVTRIATSFGRWQDEDCQVIKGALMSLDNIGAGRVLSQKFYAQPKTVFYRFHESRAYLDEISALEVSKTGDEYIRIANYVQATTNCIGNSEYFAVCCLNECISLMRELEEHLQGPVAHPTEIIKFIQDLDSPSVHAPRKLPAELVSKLNNVAEYHSGGVPLHGRLFAQWMHYAFPNECAYPLKIEADSKRIDRRMTTGIYLSHSDLPARRRSTRTAQNDFDEFQPPIHAWSDEEFLPLVEKSIGETIFALVSEPLGVLSKVALLMVGLRAAWTTLKGTIDTYNGKYGANIKKSDCV